MPSAYKCQSTVAVVIINNFANAVRSVDGHAHTQDILCFLRPRILVIFYFLTLFSYTQLTRAVLALRTFTWMMPGKAEWHRPYLIIEDNDDSGGPLWVILRISPRPLILILIAGPGFRSTQFCGTWLGVCRLSTAHMRVLRKLQSECKSDQLPIFIGKFFFWNIVISINLPIVYGDFCTTMVELRSCNPNHMTLKS